MTKKELFDLMAALEQKIAELSNDVGVLKQHLAEVIEENYSLQMENSHLRQRLESLQRDVQENSGRGPGGKKQLEIGEGYDNLARLYQEGFHICNLQFGSLRKEGDCMFCLSFLNKSK
jgi:Protein of unknown function (DUF972).